MNIRFAIDSKRNLFLFVTLFVFPGISASWLAAEEIILQPLQDNSIFSESNNKSNGAGMFLFAGTTNRRDIRRALLSFDLVDSIPDGATITNATLTLNMSRTISEDQVVGLYRVDRSWGEGESDAPREEGNGDGATPGDATWSHAVLPDQLWNTAGGDFEMVPSATISVGALGVYSWSSDGMINDIQSWSNDPINNFGWMLIGPEDAAGTVKRFDSRETPTIDNRPSLLIEYDALEIIGDFDENGLLDVTDIDLLTGEVLAGTNRAEFDVNGDGIVNQADRTKWIFELMNTYIGDSNLDGEFDTSDLITTFQAGEYEDDEPENSTWATGDWNGDREFTTNDFINAFQDGGFERGPRVAAMSVPEPTHRWLIAFFLILFLIRFRR